MNTVTRLRIAASAALLIVLATAQAVTAHAELVRARPADGATVPESPVEIIATFNEPLDGRSHIELRNEANEIVARGAVDGRELRIGLEGLLPGDYQVTWTAIGSDTHPERGRWGFTVAAAASPSPSVAPTESAPPSATTEPSVSPSAEPSAPPSPSASPAPEPGQSASGSDVLLPILIVLAIVIAGLAALLMRGRRTA